jgi:hypothetical protein
MGDVECATALQLAGFKGPFWPRTRTYSQTCLATIGAVGHAATTVASNVAIHSWAGGLVNRLARWTPTAAEEAAAASRSFVRIFGGWEISLIFAPEAMDELLKQCECKDGT